MAIEPIEGILINLKLIDTLHDFEGERGDIVINDILDSVYQDTVGYTMQPFIDNLSQTNLNFLRNDTQHNKRSYKNFSLSEIGERRVGKEC